jgi:hypothetical protein
MAGGGGLPKQSIIRVTAKEQSTSAKLIHVINIRFDNTTTDPMFDYIDYGLAVLDGKACAILSSRLM